MDYGNIPSGGKETILLVEDEPGVRKFIKVTLERFGYKVIETKDGNDALNYLSSSKEVISLALIDLVMPKMNGIEVYEKIAEIKTGLPAIFMSGYSEDILQQKGLSLNELHYITKPITPNDLLKTVKDMLRQNNDQTFTSC
jgi:DNA-binding response OmpR family regulator